jgi:hypothetical protein
MLIASWVAWCRKVGRDQSLHAGTWSKGHSHGSSRGRLRGVIVQGWHCLRYVAGRPGRAAERGLIV